MTPYYARQGIELYHCDTADFLAALAPGSVDVVFTSPPYNLGRQPSGGRGKPGGFYPPSRGGWTHIKFRALNAGYGEHDDAMPHDEYVTWQRGILARCWELLSACGAIFYNHKPRIVHGRLWTPFELAGDLPLQQIITWDRGGGVGLGDHHFCPGYEWLLLFARPDFRLRDRAASATGDVWHVPFETKRYGHPAPFPVALPAMALAAIPTGYVVDPFAGIGSALVAAKRLGWCGAGCDNNERWLEIAAKRLEQESLPLADDRPEQPRLEALA